MIEEVFSASRLEFSGGNLYDYADDEDGESVKTLYIIIYRHG